MSADVRLGTLPRPDGEELRVELTSFKGRPLCHVRLWYRPVGESELRPGKGLALRAHEIAQVATALDRASGMIDRLGRIVPEAPQADPTARW